MTEGTELIHDVREVDVVHAAADFGAGNQFREALRAIGVVTDDGTPEDADARLILMSNDFFDIPQWERLVGPFGLERLVPVKMPGLDPDLVPNHLRRLNWIIWDEVSAAEIKQKILIELTTTTDQLAGQRRLVAGVVDRAHARRLGAPGHPPGGHEGLRRGRRHASDAGLLGFALELLAHLPHLGVAAHLDGLRDLQ